MSFAEGPGSVSLTDQFFRRRLIISNIKKIQTEECFYRMFSTLDGWINSQYFFECRIFRDKKCLDAMSVADQTTCKEKEMFLFFLFVKYCFVSCCFVCCLYACYECNIAEVDISLQALWSCYCAQAIFLRRMRFPNF